MTQQRQMREPLPLVLLGSGLMSSSAQATHRCRWLEFFPDHPFLFPNAFPSSTSATKSCPGKIPLHRLRQLARRHADEPPRHRRRRQPQRPGNRLRPVRPAGDPPKKTQLLVRTAGRWQTPVQRQRHFRSMEPIPHPGNVHRNLPIEKRNRLLWRPHRRCPGRPACRLCRGPAGRSTSRIGSSSTCIGPCGIDVWIRSTFASISIPEISSRVILRFGSTRFPIRSTALVKRPLACAEWEASRPPLFLHTRSRFVNFQLTLTHRRSLASPF